VMPAAAMMTGFLSFSPTYVVEMSKVAFLNLYNGERAGTANSLPGNLTTDWRRGTMRSGRSTFSAARRKTRGCPVDTDAMEVYYTPEVVMHQTVQGT